MLICTSAPFARQETYAISLSWLLSCHRAISAARTISTSTLRVSCGVSTSRRKLMRTPFIPSEVFNLRKNPRRSTAVIAASVASCSSPVPGSSSMNWKKHSGDGIDASSPNEQLRLEVVRPNQAHKPNASTHPQPSPDAFRDEPNADQIQHKRQEN